jgi:hypothetical protein
VKTTRLRQAKEEAEKDAGHYRSNLESEYQKRVGEVWLAISSATSVGKSDRGCTDSCSTEAKAHWSRLKPNLLDRTS